MIEVQNVSKEWKRKDFAYSAIDNISFCVRRKEFLSIIGPSGCGKTTLLKLIADLLKPTNGSIIFDSSRKKSLKKLSIVFQNPALLSWRTAKENIEIANELSNRPKSKGVNKIIRLMELSEFIDHHPHQLSGGMKQRVSIGRALVANPHLLLMDEPFGSLDELTRNELNLELLKIWRKAKLTIVFITHSLSEAVLLSDRVIILSKRPTKIKKIVRIDLPRPRNITLKETSKFQVYVKCVRELLSK